MTPSWLLGIVAALMLVVAAVSAGRLAAARPWEHGALVIDTDIAHLLMAVAMAGMLARGLATLPDTAWEVIFGLMTAWFAIRVVADAGTGGLLALAGRHCAPHLVHSAAMLYIFLALTAGTMSGMSGMSGGTGSMMTLRHPTLAFLFALILVGYTIWDLDQLSGRRYHLGTPALALARAGAAGVPAVIPAQSAGASGVTRAGPASVFLLSPAVTVGCRITMGVAMTVMLVIAI